MFSATPRHDDPGKCSFHQVQDQEAKENTWKKGEEEKRK
jgi:hypothetical protein